MLQINKECHFILEDELNSLKYIQPKTCNSLIELFSSDDFFMAFSIILKRTKTKKYNQSYYINLVGKIISNGSINQKEFENIKLLFENDEFISISNRVFSFLNISSISSKFNFVNKNENTLTLSFLLNGFVQYLETTLNNNIFYKNKIIELLNGQSNRDFSSLERLVEDSCGVINWEQIYTYSKFENGNLEGIYWQGDLDISKTNITSLGKIKSAGKIFASNSKLIDLGEFESVDYLDISFTQVSSLGNLTNISELIITKSNVKSLGLIKIALKIFANDSDLEDLGNLYGVSFIDISNSKVSSLGNLISVDILKVNNTKNFSSFGDLGFAQEINASHTSITDFGNLHKVDKIYIYGCNVTRFGNLSNGFVYIDGNSINLLHTLSFYNIDGIQVELIK